MVLPVVVVFVVLAAAVLAYSEYLSRYEVFLVLVDVAVLWGAVVLSVSAVGVIRVS